MSIRTDSLVSEFQRRGVLTSGELQASLGVSQPTLARALSQLDAERIVRMGRARSTRYGLRRNIREWGSCWPLYWITESGGVDVVGNLYALAGGQWYLEERRGASRFRGKEFRDGLYPDLPWFLQDLRPQGFLGRLFAQQYADELRTPRDLRHWSSDDIILALLTHGSDLPGAFVLGRQALATAQSSLLDESDVILETCRDERYPRCADTMMEGEIAGSSAAGEQPKFTARVRGSGGEVRCVIVKFSSAAGRPEDLRWRDLLVAEHEANGVLREYGIPCASTMMLKSKGRCFLESMRFDRTQAGGRCGMVSLEAFDSAFFGAIDTPWIDAADRYQRAGWLSAEDADRLRLLGLFGGMIGNTDMHYGNASLLLNDCGVLTLAPTYDMTPMFYRPGIEGQLPSSPISLVPPPPEIAPLWQISSSLARAFWLRLASLDTISPDFRSIAANNAEVVSAMQASVS